MKKLLIIALLFVGCSSEPEEIHGCVDSNATNYNSEATINDGSCVVHGCLDSHATNYNPDATLDNNSCEYNSCVYRWDSGLTNAPYFHVCFDDWNTQQECDAYYNTLLESAFESTLPYQYYDVNYYSLYNNTCEKYCEYKDYCGDND